jgi:hypothetical protein
VADLVDDSFVGRTRDIDGYCCCCCWGCKSIWNPTGIGGSSNRVGCGIDSDAGVGGLMTRNTFSFLNTNKKRKVYFEEVELASVALMEK